MTTLQAALILHITYAGHAIDKVGLSYLMRAVAMARELRLFEGGDRIHDATMRHARDFTAWCLFNWQT